MASSTPPIPVMFFYLTEEEHGGTPSSPDGYLRIVDMSNKVTIAKIEVPRIRETFASLKNKFMALAKASTLPVPSETQSFALQWNDSAARRCQDKGCKSCAQIGVEIQKYIGMKRLSQRLAAVK